MYSIAAQRKETQIQLNHLFVSIRTQTTQILTNHKIETDRDNGKETNEYWK